MNNSSQPFGVVLGRLNPITKGHERNIGEMIARCGNRSLVVLGSCNAPMSMRHFFSYGERRAFIKALFPEVRVVGMPDYGDDADWMTALDDLLALTGVDPSEMIFFSGSEQDAEYFLAANKHVEILDRHSGTLAKVSATQVRDMLIAGGDLSQYINPAIADEVASLFAAKWEAFRKI